MKLRDALVETRAMSGTAYNIGLACGFEPLHFATFLRAHLARRLPGRCIEVETGTFGDLAGNIERLSSSPCDEAVIVVEWQDLDPRLGVRALGGWGEDAADDIRRTAFQRIESLVPLIDSARNGRSIVLSLPTLPLPPLFHGIREQAAPLELELNREMMQLGAAVSRMDGACVLSSAQVELRTPPAKRLDVASDLAAGFPYTLEHASELAEMVAELLHPAQSKKGLITDLDNTVWRGLLGEDGIEGVAWDLDRQAQLHGLYQQTLNAIAETGALLAVASKNDAALVEEAFAHPQLVLRADRVFPREASWGEKSDSVRRILETWNVAPDDVVFVDDSPLELAEVSAAFPAMECLLFEPQHPDRAYDLLRHIRQRFSRQSLTEEDRIRAASIVSGAKMGVDARAVTSRDDFLAGLEARISFTDRLDPTDGRPLELINKTNQFNLNGRRLTQPELRGLVAKPGGFVIVASYADKYGPLGKIAVMAGESSGRTARLRSWVMSCRAFSRRIEFKCLERLFEHTGAERVELEFAATPRNTPVQELLRQLCGSLEDQPLILSREQFAHIAPPLHFAVA
jgi:FkbH-like protein